VESTFGNLFLQKVQRVTIYCPALFRRQFQRSRNTELYALGHYVKVRKY
jgi:hypothetical protein